MPTWASQVLAMVQRKYLKGWGHAVCLLDGALKKYSKDLGMPAF